jgi:hypothetical protein
LGGEAAKRIRSEGAASHLINTGGMSRSSRSGWKTNSRSSKRHGFEDERRSSTTTERRHGYSVT